MVEIRVERQIPKEFNIVSSFCQNHGYAPGKVATLLRAHIEDKHLDAKEANTFYSMELAGIIKRTRFGTDAALHGDTLNHGWTVDPIHAADVQKFLSLNPVKPSSVK